MEIKTKKHIFAGCALGGGTVLSALLSGLNPFVASKPLSDESGVFAYVGMAMKNGQIPYVDSFDHQGPLVYIFNHLGAGNGWLTTWFIELLCLAVTFVFAYKTARLFTEEIRAVVAVAISFAAIGLFLESGNLIEEYALPFQMIGIYMYLSFFENPDLEAELKFSPIAALGGLCFGGVFMLRLNLLWVWLVYSVPVLLDRLKKKDKKGLLRLFVAFLVGFGVIFLPLLLWLVASSAAGEFFKAYVLFNFALFGTQVSGAGLFASLGHYILACPAFAIGLIYMGCRLIKKRDLELNLPAIVLMVITLVCISLQGEKAGHYGLSLLPTLVYPYALLLNGVKEGEKRRIILVPTFLFCALMIVPLWAKTWGLVGRNNSGSTACEEEVAAGFISANTKEDERIVVYGANDTLYVKSGRLSASRYSYQFPISRVESDILNSFFETISKEPPFIVAVEKAYSDGRIEGWLEKNGYESVLRGQSYIVYGHINP